MSLDSLFKQNNKKKTPTEFTDDDVSGEFRSRSEEESIAASEASERTKTSKAAKRAGSASNSRKNTIDDQALPEKKRARRRLIGAVALTLAAVIGLPMVFDAEPKPSASKITVEIPTKDAVPSTVLTAPATKEILSAASVSAPPVVKQSTQSELNQGIDKSEEILTPPQPVERDIRSITKVDTNQKSTPNVERNSEKNSEKKQDLVTGNKIPATTQQPAINKVVPEVVKKVEAKLEPKLESKAEAKKEIIDDAARALALLEGRSLPEPSKLAAKSNKTDSKPDGASGNFIVQVAAFNSASKVRELQTKLKAANIASYTQKITTTTGEVIRVRLGPFHSKAEAEKMRLKLVKIGLNGSLIPA